MPSLKGFLNGNARRFGRIRLGCGFSDCCRLFGVAVLQGLEETLTRFKPKLIVEVWSENMEMVKGLLKKHGYSMIAVSNTFGSVSGWCVYLFCIPTAN
jgi:hypothetical protein